MVDIKMMEIDIKYQNRCSLGISLKFEYALRKTQSHNYIDICVSPCDKGQLCFDAGVFDAGNLSEKTTLEISHVDLPLELKNQRRSIHRQDLKTDGSVDHFGVDFTNINMSNALLFSNAQNQHCLSQFGWKILFC